MSQEIKGPILLKNEGDQSHELSEVKSNCCNICGLIIQILIWCLIGVTIIYYINGKTDEIYDFIIVLSVLYVAYIIGELCCSDTFQYLCNRTSTSSIYDKMGDIFKTVPEIKFNCECYHYEIRSYTERDKNGKIHYRREERKVTTFTDSYKIPIYSCRDVSGLFYLNCPEALAQKKAYIQLELNQEINFADSISYSDYVKYKDHFWRANRFRDTHMNFSETRYVPGLDKNNFVQMGDFEPAGVNVCNYIICTLLTVVEFYKRYVNSFSLRQKYTIRKLVSTRYNLDSPSMQEKYVNFAPQINIQVQQYTYSPNYYNYVNNEMNVDLPTKEELEQAEQYQNQIPNYQIMNVGGESQFGVVQDNPNYSSYNQNLPPPAFAQIPGNIPLDIQYVNNQGNLPNNFGQGNYNYNSQPYPDFPTQIELEQQSAQQFIPPAGSGYIPPQNNYQNSY